VLRLLHPRRWSLAVSAVVIVLAFAIGGIVAERTMHARQSLEERAAALAERGDAVGAEAVYWTLLDRGPITLPLLIDFLDNHARLSTPQLEMSEDGEQLKLHAPAAKPDDARVDALFEGNKLPPDVATLAHFWRSVTTLAVTDDERKVVVAAADGEPPTPWANHLLGEEAFRTGQTTEAAARFDREGIHFPGTKDDRADDIERALQIWIGAGEWDKVAERLRDPRYAPFVDAQLRYHYALHAHDFIGAIRWFFPANVSRATPGVYALAALSGLLWFWFCARIGQMGEKKKLRIPLYVGAFALGVASIAMTVAIIEVEETYLHFVEKKNAIADLIYFVFGVGLREELSKLVFFAPLLLVTRRWGGRREVVTCGALVGLGFAAEENIGYFSGHSITVALPRFLLANLFHISLAAISATALDDFFRDRENNTQALSRAFLTVVVAHGLYDFFIGQPNLSFLTIVSFVWIARQFFHLVRSLRGRERGGPPLLARFVFSLAILTGASFIYGTFVAGPALAARAMAAGLLAEAIIIYFFVQELETM
jgi:RsiW-degrading membrane proteinase PrsW (M82 family)